MIEVLLSTRRFDPNTRQRTTMLTALCVTLLSISVLAYPPAVPKAYKIDLSRGERWTSHVNCQEHLLWWYSRNSGRVECRKDPKKDPQPPVEIFRAIKSWDVDYLHPPEKVIVTWTAVHKCKVLQDYGGCPRELIQRELAQDFLFECPKVERPYFSWVNIIGYYPNNIAECDSRHEDDVATKSYLENKTRSYWRQSYREAYAKKYKKTVYDQVTEIASTPVDTPDMICFEVDGSAVGGSYSGHWFQSSEGK